MPEDRQLWTMLDSVPLVKFGPPPKTRGMRFLLSDLGIGGGGGNGSLKSDSGGGGGSGSSSSASSRKGKYISFWKPEVSGGWMGELRYVFWWWVLAVRVCFCFREVLLVVVLVWWQFWRCWW